MTPMKAIRLKCLDCCFGLPNEVTLCPATDCSLWPYRSGHNPKLKGTRPGAAANLTKNALQGGASGSSNDSDGKSYGEDSEPSKPIPQGENGASMEVRS